MANHWTMFTVEPEDGGPQRVVHAVVIAARKKVEPKADTMIVGIGFAEHIKLPGCELGLTTNGRAFSIRDVRMGLN